MSPTLAPERKWMALALLALAQFVVVLDASIVNVALPSIGRDLQFSQENLSWVINAYTLTFGGFLLLGGRMADLLGRRRMFMAGIVLFGIASLLGGFAETEGQLIAARALQGLGAALLSPAALSLVTVIFKEGAERNKALGVWGAVAGSGGAVGVLLGGMLTEWAGWEWVLFVNVPIAVVGSAAGSAPAAREPQRGRAPLRHRRRRVRDGRPVAAGLRARRRAERRLGLDADARPDRAGARPDRGVRGDRAPQQGAARPVPGHLPASDDHRHQPDGAVHRGIAVLDVLLHLALHAAGARLRRAQGRALLPAAGGRDHRLGRPGLGPDDPLRLQAGADHGPDPHRGRPDLVLPGLGGRQLRRPTSCSRRCWPRSGSASRSCR